MFNNLVSRGGKLQYVASSHFSTVNTLHMADFQATKVMSTNSQKS